jgi:hypothetical protein
MLVSQNFPFAVSYKRKKHQYHVKMRVKYREQVSTPWQHTVPESGVKKKWFALLSHSGDDSEQFFD